MCCGAVVEGAVVEGGMNWKMAAEGAAVEGECVMGWLRLGICAMRVSTGGMWREWRWSTSLSDTTTRVPMRLNEGIQITGMINP
jgi:hypothetical protein